MLEALDLGGRQTIRHRRVPYVHLVIHPRDGLGWVALGEQAQANLLDYRIPFGLVFEVAHFSGVTIIMTTSEVKKMAIINIAKVERVSEVRARVSLF